MNDKLREAIEGICTSAEIMGEMAGLEPGVGKAVKAELGLFMMYLSASDGAITWNEAELISDLCELDLTPSNYGQYIREKNIYSTKFEQKIPTILQFMVEMDNQLLEQGHNIQGSRILIDAFKIVGDCLIHADEQVDEKETKDYECYIKMLEEYREKNYKGAIAASSGFVKKEGTREDDSTEEGVPAPRKG
jgi:hypothetical protein